MTTGIDTITVVGRLRKTSHLWLFLVIAAVELGLLAAAALGLRREVSANDLGFDLQRSAGRVGYVGAVSPRWSGLAVGDQLVAMNGVPMTADGFFAARLTVPVGPLSVEVERAGTRSVVSGEVVPSRPSLQLAVTVRWLCSLLLWLAAVGVFVLRPGAKLSWVFFLALAALMPLVAITTAFPIPLSLVFPLSFALFPLAGTLMLQLYTMFPRVDRLSRLVKPALGVAATLAVLRPVLWFSFDDAGKRFEWFDVASRLFGAFVAVPGVVALVRSLLAGRRANDATLVSVSRALLLGAVLGQLVPLVTNAAVRALHIEGGVLHQGSAASVMVFAVLTAAVLVRHNPMELDRYAASVAAYALTVGGMAVIFVMGVVTVPMAARALGVADDTDVLVFFTAVTSLSVAPVVRRVREGIDRWFSRAHRDALQTAEVLSRVSALVRTEAPEVALGAIVEAAMNLGGERAACWQLDAAGKAFVRTAWRHGPTSVPPLPRHQVSAALLEHRGGVAGLAPAGLPADAQQSLWTLDLAAAAPIRAHGVGVGFLGVGRRASGFGYRPDDLEFLGALAALAAAVVERGEFVSQVGRYRVERRLGAGGMAEVFLAWQLGPGGFERKVALKRLLPELAEDPNASTILLDEARITSRLTHPNIVHVYEVGIEAGQPFIAMEFIDGPPLRALISAQAKSGQATPLPIALAVAKALLGALEHAHSRTDPHGAPLEVVHRDVTPANVLVSSVGEIKLVDFGLVHATTRLYRTQTGVARGTLPYMSREQFMHEPCDRRSDVYSAAATLYELFSLTRAFPTGPSAPKPAAASTVCAVNPAVDPVFERGFAWSPDERYPTALAMWEALAAALPTAPASEEEVAAWVHGLAPLWRAVSQARTATVAPTDVTATTSVPPKG